MSQKQSQENQIEEIAARTIHAGFYNQAITQPTKQTEATTEREKKSYGTDTPWIPYFKDSENLFPQVVAWLALNSPTNAAIINSKKSISKGVGFKYLDKSGNELDKAPINPFIENPSKEAFYDLQDLFEDMLHNFIKFGEVYILGKKATVGSTTSFTARVEDTTKCRLMRDGKRVAVNPYWEFIKNSKSSEYWKGDYTTYYPLWNGIGTPPNEFCFHYRRRESGYDNYGVPDYWAGAKDGMIEYLVDVYNKARLENGHFIDAWITYVGNPPKGMTSEEYLKKEYEKVGGAHNAGKPKLSLVNDPEAVPNIQFAQGSKEGEFLQLEESAFQGIIRAHKWFPSLAGIQVAGQLGSNQQIRNEYNIVINQVVPDYQRPMLRILNKLLEIAEVPVSVDVINKMPIGFDDQINPENVMTVNEARKHLKMQPLIQDYMYQDENTNEYFGDMLIADMKYKLNVSNRTNGTNN